jgi:hypothetical protein
MTLYLVSYKTADEGQVDFIAEEGINKIGIISVWSDLENQQYAYKDEIFTTDKKIIKDILNVINDGEIDRSIKLDRLPAEYEIQIYYDEEVLKCYYWYEELKYNFNISGFDGEITIDGKVINELIKLITGETDREKIVDPY